MKTKLAKLPKILQDEGLKGLWWRVKVRVAGDPYLKHFQHSYEEWYKTHGIESLDLLSLKKEANKLKHKPLISILTPVYNTNIEHLKACINSVVAQVYENWELILVDDHSSNDQVWETLQNFSQKDKRIKILKRHSNGHICQASNDALAQAKGEWVALLDHDDYLWPNALLEIVKTINEKPQVQFIYTDEDKIAEDGKTHCDPFFKPDWSPHFLWSCNYITHFAVIKTNLVNKIGGFREGVEGAQDWDLFIRLIDEVEGWSKHPHQKTCPITHIPTIIYSWRKSPTSTASEKHSLTAKNYAYSAQEKVLNDFFAKKGGAVVKATQYLGIYDVQPILTKKPKISVIIPTNAYSLLLEKLLYYLRLAGKKYELEVLIVANNCTSEDEKEIKVSLRPEDQYLTFNQSFNFSAMCNLATKQAGGEVLLFLNNDVEIMSEDWLEKLLAYALRPEVGGIAPRLLYLNGRLQNNGLVLAPQINREKIKIGEWVAPYFRNSHPKQNMGIGTVLHSSIRNYTALTGAVFMIEKRKLQAVGGWDEKLAVAFNDVDLCLKLNDAGYFNVLNPFVTMIHHESQTLGQPSETRIALMQTEENYMQKKWGDKLYHDHFFSKWYLLKDGKMEINAKI